MAGVMQVNSWRAVIVQVCGGLASIEHSPARTES